MHTNSQCLDGAAVKTRATRYVALDVLRGMTVAGMILVNNPGSWSFAYAPLRHSSWSGCTPTDLVFPFFLFVVGAAMAFSFAKFTDGGGYRKLYTRAALIFLVGLAMNAFPFYNRWPDANLSFWENTVHYYSRLRIFGVLQRIALSYALGGTLALWLKKPKKIACAFGGLLLLYWAILYFFGKGGDPYSLEGNVVLAVDKWLIGEAHMYKGYGIPFDPEGLLGCIAGAGTVLMGYLAGHFTRTSKAKIEAVGGLYTWGLLSLGAAIVWNNWLPINKPLWTSSYVLYAGGWTLLLFGFFIYLIDIKGREKLFFPFKSLGLNPLFAFVMAGLFSKILGGMIHWTNAAGQNKTVLSWFYNDAIVPIFGNNELGSLIYALCYVLVFTLMAIWLYRKKIVIKL